MPLNSPKQVKPKLMAPKPLTPEVNLDTKLDLDSIHSEWAKTKDSRLMSTMLDNLNADIDKAVYANAGLNAGPAVRTKAKVLAAKAIKSYVPKSGSGIRSWVYTQLQPLSRYARDLMPSPVPERAFQQLSALKRLEGDFYDNRGRAPSDAELADLSGLSIKALNKVRQLDKRTLSEGKIVSQEDSGTTAGDLVATENKGFKQDVLAMMYASVGPQEQIILEYNLGYNNKPILTNNELAKRMRISPGRVSQMTTRLAAKLDEFAELNKKM